MSETIHDSNNKKPRLGRGLGSLFNNMDATEPVKAPTAPNQEVKSSSIVTNTNVASVDSTTPPELRIWKVGIEKMVSGAYQPRKSFDEVEIKNLSDSIKANGILQPILVRKRSDGKFEIIGGERRWRAAQMAGLTEVPVIVKYLTNQNSLELAIVENIQRADLSPLEEAEAYKRLATEFSLTQSQIAEKVGKERATVANLMRLLDLSEPTKKMLNEGLLSQGHAKVLLSLDHQAQNQFAKQAVDRKLSVRQLEQLIQKRASTEIEQKSHQGDDAHDHVIGDLRESLQKALGTRVSIDYNAGKGRMTLFFYNDEELNQLVDRLKN